MSVLLGLLAALFYGMADFLAQRLARGTSTYKTMFYGQIVGLAVLSVYFLGGHGRVPHAPPAVWAWAVATAALNTVLGLALYEAFRVGRLALMSPIVASFGAVTALLSLLDGTRLAPAVWAGIGLAVAGVIATSIPAQAADPDGGPKRGTAGLGWALMAAVGFGVTFWLLGTRVTPTLGGVVPVWLFRLTAFGLLGLGAVPARQSLRLPRRTLWAALGLGLVDTAAMLCLTLGLARGPVAVVTVLASLFSVVTVLLAFAFGGERLSRRQWAGILVIFLGVALVNV